MYTKYISWLRLPISVWTPKQYFISALKKSISFNYSYNYYFGIILHPVFYVNQIFEEWILSLSSGKIILGSAQSKYLVHISGRGQGILKKSTTVLIYHCHTFLILFSYLPGNSTTRDWCHYKLMEIMQ